MEQQQIYSFRQKDCCLITRLQHLLSVLGPHQMSQRPQHQLLQSPCKLSKHLENLVSGNSISFVVLLKQLYYILLRSLFYINTLPPGDNILLNLAK